MSAKSRDELVAAIAEFTGPLGPFTTLEQLENRRGAWLSSLNEADLPGLLDILKAPPEQLVSDAAIADAFELEMADALAAAGRANPVLALESFRVPLSNPQARPAAIVAIGCLGVPEGVTLLAPLVDDDQLSAGELERLACSLGDIGTPAAAAVLEALRNRPAARQPAVQDEIQIALDRCARTWGRS